MYLTEYQASVAQQGKATLKSYAYVEHQSDNIICMYLDTTGDTHRAYPNASSTWTDPSGEQYPCIWYNETEDIDEESTLIFFPELDGWEIFSLGGGKSCAIVLVKKG